MRENRVINENSFRHHQLDGSQRFIKFKLIHVIFKTIIRYWELKANGEAKDIIALLKFMMPVVIIYAQYHSRLFV